MTHSFRLSLPCLSPAGSAREPNIQENYGLSKTSSLILTCGSGAKEHFVIL